MLYFVLIISVWIIFEALRPKKIKDIYYDGRKSTKYEQQRCKEAVMNVVEKFPDGQFLKDNPEYYEELINSVDISEIEDILKK